MRFIDFTLIDYKFFILLLILIILDIGTGLLNSIKNHTLKSAILRTGGYKKFLSIFIVLVSYSMDVIYFNADILYTISTSFYILYECLSIIENLAMLGVPIPKKVKSILLNLKESVDNDSNNK